MLSYEACYWLVSTIGDEQLCVYDISGKALPVPIENKKGIACAHEVYKTEWWDNQNKESEDMPEFGISPDKVSILRDDVTRIFKITSWLLDSLEHQIHGKGKVEAVINPELPGYLVIPTNQCRWH
ncbi:MAG: hypothetical protein Q7U57_02605 [Methylovulum sp.]|nr:hypothetical protein [Methylovulum sp.]